MRRILQVIQRAYKELRVFVRAIVGFVFVLAALGVSGRLGDFLQKQFQPQTAELLSPTLIANGLMVLGYAIQAGVILFFLDSMTKERERKTLTNVRKATFGKMLSRAEWMASLLLRASTHEWAHFRHERELSRRLSERYPNAIDVQTQTVDRSIITSKVLDDVRGDYIERNEEDYLILERGYQEILDECAGLINFVDDQIETHISALDFESGFIANEMRTTLRDFLQYTQSEHQRIVGYEKINRAFQQKLLRKATRLAKGSTTRSLKGQEHSPQPLSKHSVAHKFLNGFTLEEDIERVINNQQNFLDRFFAVTIAMHGYVISKKRFIEDKFDFGVKNMSFYADNDIKYTDYEWSANAKENYEEAKEYIRAGGRSAQGSA